MTFRNILIGALLLLLSVQAQAADIIEDFRSVDSNLNIAATGQTSSPGLIKHDKSTYAWGGWNNAPTDATNVQLRFVSSREVQFRGDASLPGSYLISRFGVTCELDVIELNKTRSSRKISFLVRDAATQNWYISDILEPELGATRYNVTDLAWWPVTDGNAELNGDTFVPLGFGDEIAWPGISIDGGGVHCEGDGASPLEWNIIKFLEAGSNQPPEIRGGASQTAYLSEGGTVDVNALATDDGFPNPPGALTFNWTVLQEPEGATVTIAPTESGAVDPNIVGTSDFVQATFDTRGKYTLQVEVSDGEMTASDTVEVDVYPKPYETISLTPEEDVFVRSNRATTNQNGNANLRVRGTGWLSYVKFDVYGLDGSFVVTGAIKDAKLRLYARDAIAETRVSAVTYGPGGEWFAGEITWATDDLVWGAILDQDAPIDKGLWYEFDVLDMVIGEDGKVTFGLDAPSESANRDWAAMEAGDDTAPQLVLIVDPDQAYAPLPLHRGIEVDPRPAFTTLSWYPGAPDVRATANTVYMGTDPDPFTNPMNGFPRTVAKEASNPDWLELAFNADLDPNTTYYWGIDNGETNSDVWAFTTMKVHPDLPISLTPANGAVDVLVPDEAVFTYTLVEGSASEVIDLYVSADRALVEALDPSVRIANVHEGYDPELGIDARGLVGFAPLTTYYYRFAGSDGTATWANPIQHFTTYFFVGVEEFETGLTDTGRGGTWTGNVSLQDDPQVAHFGSACLQLDYSAGTANATASFVQARNWAQTNMDVLTLFVRGTSTNAAAEISVSLEDATGAKATLAGAVDVTDEDPWQALNLNLADFEVDLAAVKNLSLTVTSTGPGTLYVDDVRLYAPVDESGLLGFLARYPFDADGSDAGPGGLALSLHAKGSGSFEIDNDTAVGPGAFRIHGSGSDFENGAYAKLPGDDNLDIRGAITVSLWMKEDGTQPDSPWAGLFGEGLDNPSYMREQSFQILRASNGRIRWKCERDNDPNMSGDSTLWYMNGTDGPDTRDGKWHHIVGTYDAVLGHAIYVDGLQRAFAPGTGLINDPGDGVGIMAGAKDHEEVNGQLTGDPKHFFFGWLDEIVVYDRALNPAEVDLVYRQGVIIDGDLNGDGVID